MIVTVDGYFSKPKPGVHILNSHFVSRHNPGYEMYCDFLQLLSQNCDLIRIEDAVRQIEQKKNTTDCLVSFTYDDGFEECHSMIAPALENFKVNGAFFVNGGFINGNAQYKKNFTENIVKVYGKNPLSWPMIKDLHNRGHVIGSHTLDHVNMNSKDYELIDYQISRNKQLIEECILEPCEYFSFPFGQFKHINNETLSQAEKYHKYIFSGTDYKNYFSYQDRIINRRHIESDWPRTHIMHFLSAKRSYNHIA